MIVYHRTFAADQILREGFRDAEGNYLTLSTYSGVWVSDSPLTVSDGAIGDRLLSVDVPEDLFVEFEWIDESGFQGHREALVPAERLNRYQVTEIEAE
ncbi:MAG TPA: hypothetical protein VNG12_14790 [Acidimicrobiales bacterium]|nr:hypothetical protein [Acidimicrobiales bacterium]